MWLLPLHLLSCTPHNYKINSLLKKKKGFGKRKGEGEGDVQEREGWCVWRSSPLVYFYFYFFLWLCFQILDNSWLALQVREKFGTLDNLGSSVSLAYKTSNLIFIDFHLGPHGCKLSSIGENWLLLQLLQTLLLLRDHSNLRNQFCCRTWEACGWTCVILEPHSVGLPIPSLDKFKIWSF